MNGTWQTTGGSGGPAAGLVAVAVAAAAVCAAVAAWIITKLLLIALITVALLVIAVMLVLVVRRIRHPEGTVQLARQGPALRAHAEQPAIAARPSSEIHFHGGTHLHLTSSADSAGHPQALPLRDAVTDIKED